MLQQLGLLFFPVLMAFAASSDLLTMRISNKLVLLLAAGFFVMALIIQIPLEQVGMHVLCGALVLAVTFTMFAKGWIGGGDAKLAAATALWLGFELTLTYLIYTSFFGGILTLLILGLRRLPSMSIITRFRWLERLHDPKQGVPYGIAMAIAGMIVYADTIIFERLIA
jgi:prepilin peptidase CpaA